MLRDIRRKKYVKERGDEVDERQEHDGVRHKVTQGNIGIAGTAGRCPIAWIILLPTLARGTILLSAA